MGYCLKHQQVYQPGEYCPYCGAPALIAGIPWVPPWILPSHIYSTGDPMPPPSTNGAYTIS